MSGQYLVVSMSGLYLVVSMSGQYLVVSMSGLSAFLPTYLPYSRSIHYNFNTRRLQMFQCIATANLLLDFSKKDLVAMLLMMQSSCYNSHVLFYS